MNHKTIACFIFLLFSSSYSCAQVRYYWEFIRVAMPESGYLIFDSAEEACEQLIKDIPSPSNLGTGWTIVGITGVASGTSCRVSYDSYYHGEYVASADNFPYEIARYGSTCAQGYSLNEPLGQCDKTCPEGELVVYPDDCQAEQIECFNPHGFVTPPLTCPQPPDNPDKDVGPPDAVLDSPRDSSPDNYKDVITPPDRVGDTRSASTGGNGGNNGCTASPGVGNPINVATGNKYQREVDFISRVGSLPLEVIRTYNSLVDYEGNFGSHWSSNLDIRANINLAENRIDIRLPDGRVFNFTHDGSEWVSTLDVHATLTEVGSNYLFRSVDQIDYTFNASGALLRVRNNYGHWLFYTYNLIQDGGQFIYQLIRITDHYGNDLDISYHATRNLITSISVMGKTFTYHYDETGGPGDGNLTSVDYPADDGSVASRRYLYKNERFPNALTGIIDEEGKRFATFRYNDSGRANLSEHNGGAERITVDYSSAYDVNDPRAVVTNAEGHQWIYHLERTSYGFTRVRYIEGLGSPNCAAANTHNTYDANGLVVATTHGSGSTATGSATRFSYNAQGYITEKTTGYQWNNNVVTNNLADLVETADMQRIETVWHSTLGKPELVTLSGKNATGSWEPYRSIDPEYLNNGYLSSWTVSDLTNYTEPYVTNGQSRTWSYSYTYHDVGESRIATRSVDGPAAGSIDSTTSTYDGGGRLTQTTNALNHTVTYSNHNAAGLPQTVIDANGVETTLVYDARNRLIQTTTASGTPLATTTQIDYYANGLLKRVTSAYGTEHATWSEYQYNDARQLIEIRNNLDDYITLTPSALNGQWLVQDVFDSSQTLQQKQQRTQDDLGRILTLLYADGATERVRYGYDERNNLTSTILGGDTTTEVIRLYDVLNRIQQINHADGGVSQYEYDSAGNLARVTDQRNLETTYQYDGLGNLMQVVSPDTGTTQYTYDNVGNRITQTDARGVVINYSYDVLNRLTSTHDPADASATTISYTYDSTAGNNSGIGRLTRVQDLSGETQYTYDALGRLTQKIVSNENKHYRWSYTYNIAGNLERLYYPSGRMVRYERDNLQRISAVYTTTWSGAPERLVANNFTYLPFGPMQSFTYANGVTNTLSYDNNYRISGISNQGSNSILDWIYDYDSFDNISSIIDNDNSNNNQSFTYDPQHRIDVATGSYGVIDYDYDLVGNRTQRSITDASQSISTDSYTYAASSNRLSSIQQSPSGTSQVFAYSANGNLTSNSATGATLSYNSYNRLTGNTGGSTGSGTYTQNSQGQRTSKIASTSSSLTDSHFFYNNNAQLLAEYHSVTQSVIREYLYANGQLITWVAPNPAADTDGDGMDDDWEQQFFNDLSRTGTSDSDGDGYTDFEEYTAGSLANNASSYPLTGSVTDLDGDGLPDSWELIHFGHLYRTGLGDFDNDGISDSNEFIAGSNPDQAAILAFTHPDVVFAYTMDTLTGTTLTDETGQQHGVINQASSASGVFGNSLYFDGNSAVDLGNQDAIFAGADKQWSLSLWAKAADVTGTTRLVSQTGNGTSPDELQFHLSVQDGKVVLAVFMQSQQAAYRVYETGAVISNNLWSHIVVTYDGHTDSNNGQDRVGIYINGINQNITMISAGALGDMLTGTAHLALGADIAGDGTQTSTGRLVGNIDQVRIFSRELLPFEAGNLYEEWSRTCTN